MNTRTAKKRIREAGDRVTAEINGLRGDNMYARGGSTEGYSGGYRQALDDVLLLLSDIEPTTRSYWKQLRSDSDPTCG